ncbi:GNAT family N-acetyltransferase [Rickettsiales bacterium]|nr:GNAT family N-acetyltransferase [Rickettsiales bacterium]
MQKKIEYSLIKKKDLKEVERLQIDNINEINNVWNFDEMLSFILKKESFSRVAKLNKIVIGFSFFLKIQDTLEVFLIFVEPKFRRKGIARQFFEDGIDFCHKNLINKILLEVNIMNKNAICFYKKINFKKLKVRENYYSIGYKKYDALVMQYKLS